VIGHPDKSSAAHGENAEPDPQGEPVVGRHAKPIVKIGYFLDGAKHLTCVLGFQQGRRFLLPISAQGLSITTQILLDCGTPGKVGVGERLAVEITAFSDSRSALAKPSWIAFLNSLWWCSLILGAH